MMSLFILDYSQIQGQSHYNQNQPVKRYFILFSLRFQIFKISISHIRKEFMSLLVGENEWFGMTCLIKFVLPTK